MKITFLHPTNSALSFPADVTPELTQQEAIDGLIIGDQDGPFLPPVVPTRPYQLVVQRTGTQIPPNVKFGEAGVAQGDVIQVLQDAQGARC